MERRKKLPDCQCKVCLRFNIDIHDVMSGIPKTTDMPAALRDVLFVDGCDWCGRKNRRTYFIPQIIKDFLRIEHLCEGCKWVVHRTRQETYWPICWGSTSDDELKWFLIEFILRHFKQEVHRLSPAQVAKDKAFQEWLDTLRPPDEPEDLDIQIKPRWKIRARVVDVTS